MFESFKSALHNRQRKKWGKKRRLGKRSFIVRRGVLRWGGIMFVLTTFTHALTCHGKPDGMLVLSALIACPFAGYLWARSMWYVNERRYSGAREQQDSIKE
jgi:4-hydroxybenzoate polyprenyltransferase